jgi:hypothetical protein
MKKSFWLLFAVAFLMSARSYATPSTQIWNPSTDIQAVKVWHLGIDNYFSVVDNRTKPVNVPTDVNLTYGLCKNLEVGFDYFGVSDDPLQFNAKYGLPEGTMMPAIAVGGCNFGTQTDTTKGATNFDMFYVVIAKTFKPVGRFSVGYYTGNEKLLIDETGAKANTGAILSWDKQINDKWWASIDCATGQSSYGVTSFGFSYAFAPNTSVIFGYVIPNNPYAPATYTNPINHMVTTQLDINF